MSREEFEKIAEKYMDTIYRVAYSWMKNQHDANDVTQIVLLKFYKTTKSFESDDHIKNWLIKVTVNECKMIFRSPWSKTEDITDYAQTLGFEEEQHYDLFQAVMKLDKKYSVLLMLFYYDGYSTKEISAMIGVPEKTVSTRLFRAKAKLKNYLKED
ncbi:MAG: sigma-70 family RNA polymerase sigma factor [Lachnospiraceae bacterium]|nr:sigma-70 family RNA polymerase sigma factor [Lachnospiraceae bacterium]